MRSCVSAGLMTTRTLWRKMPSTGQFSLVSAYVQFFTQPLSIFRADRDALYALMTAKGISLDNAGFEYPAEYSLPSAKKARLENGTEVTSQYPELAYPDTDAQFPDETQGVESDPSNSAATTSMSAEEYAKYCEDYYMNYLAAKNIPLGEYGDSAEDAATSSKESSASGAVAPLKGGWTKCVDEDSGAIYYFNEETQESSWGLPSTA